MNRYFVYFVLAALVVSTSAFAAGDTARLGGGTGAGGSPVLEIPDTPADVLIASSTNGGQFTDLAPYYSAAFTAAGVPSVTVINDPEDAPFPFPVPFTPNEYGTVCVLSNDNWWGSFSTGMPEANVSTADENALAAYMDLGGKMIFSGQDYLYARGSSAGFPQIYLGVQNHTDDINFSDTDITYNGVAGGAIAGRSGSLHAEPLGVPCFTDNPFFSDDVVPFTVGLMTYNSQPSGVNGQGGTSWVVPGVFSSVFSTVELACTTDTQQFNGDVRAMYAFVGGGVTTVEPATWGAVKDMFAR